MTLSSLRVRLAFLILIVFALASVTHAGHPNPRQTDSLREQGRQAIRSMGQALILRVRTGGVSRTVRSSTSAVTEWLTSSTAFRCPLHQLWTRGRVETIHRDGDRLAAEQESLALDDDVRKYLPEISPIQSPW